MIYINKVAPIVFLGAFIALLVIGMQGCKTLTTPQVAQGIPKLILALLVLAGFALSEYVQIGEIEVPDYLIDHVVEEEDIEEIYFDDDGNMYSEAEWRWMETELAKDKAAQNKMKDRINRVKDNMNQPVKTLRPKKQHAKQFSNSPNAIIIDL